MTDLRPPRLTLSRDIAAADWIGERVDNSVRAVVGGLVPAGFEAYARVLHPATTDEGPLRWADVARRLGKSLTPGDWFQDLADSVDEAGFAFQAPRLGEIPDGVLESLLPLLLTHTLSDHGWFCLWEGWAMVNGSMDRVIFRSVDSIASGRASRFSARAPFTPQARKASRLSWRPDLLLFEGPLEATGELGAHIVWDPVDGDGIQDQATTSFERHTPSLFWPDDHRWCAVNDNEASFTWIAGSAALIKTLHETPTLEVTPAE